MNLIEVYIGTYLNKGNAYQYGEILFDCGLKIKGIHFHSQKNIVHVNYPAVRDGKRIFHPSFQLKDSYADRAIKGILEYAWNRMKNDGKNSIYGCRKAHCCKELVELSKDDFEWLDEKKKCEYSFSGMGKSAVRVELIDDRRSIGALRCAYARVYFDESFVISNLKVFDDGEGIGKVQFPHHMQEEAVTFMGEGDRSWIESCIIERFQDRAERTGNVIKTENSTNEEQLFKILWSASDNGYILQSKIRGILEQNRIDWENIYHVKRISELVKKMSFMSLRRLETSPEHYVDWVVITYEKDPEPVVVESENTQILPDDVKEKLHNVLADEYMRNGKIILSSVIPYLSEEHPEILEKFPKVKLKRILQSCNFIRFEGGPMPPIYIHIQDENVDLTRQEDSSVTCIAHEDVQFDVVSQKHPDLTEQVRMSTQKIEEYDQLAKKNPFKFVPNTKLIQEQNIPDSKLPKITADEAMRRFLRMASLEQLDFMDLEIVYWVSKLQYSKSSFLYDLIVGGLIEVPAGKRINKDKLSTRLMRLYKVNLVGFYKLCSVDENGNIVSKSAHRILMVTAYGRTQLRVIGRQSDFDFFMALDNIEKILKKLSVNQWFTKFMTIFKNVSYYPDVIVTAKIAEANAARISLVIVKDDIPVFVNACKRGSLFEQDIRSGDFAFWIKRVSNLMENYNELYIGEHQVSFIKKPKLIFICEDSEHCMEIYGQIVEAVSKIKSRTVLDNLWFAEDINIYNDFLHAHYSFDCGERRICENIDEFLGVEIGSKLVENADFTNEQSPEEDMRILKELEREENLMILPFEDSQTW